MHLWNIYNTAFNIIDRITTHTIWNKYFFCLPSLLYLLIYIPFIIVDIACAANNGNNTIIESLYFFMNNSINNLAGNAKDIIKKLYINVQFFIFLILEIDGFLQK